MGAAAIVVWSLVVSGAGDPASVPPDPNGYDALMTAASKLRAADRSDDDDAKAIAEVRAVLDLPYEVPPAMYDIAADLVTQIGRFKVLALAFQKEGDECVRNNDLEGAMRSYLDMVRLGQKVEKGPIICLLTGLAMEKNALGLLKQLEPKLSGGHRAVLVERLRDLNHSRPSFREVRSSEEYFMRRNARNALFLAVGKYKARWQFESAEKSLHTLEAAFEQFYSGLKPKE